MATKRKRTKKETAAASASSTTNSNTRKNKSEPSKTKKISAKTSKKTPKQPTTKSSQASSTSNSPSDCFLYNLIARLEQIQNNAPNATNAIQAVTTASFTPRNGHGNENANVNDEDENVNLIILSILVLNVLLKRSRDNLKLADSSSTADNNDEAKKKNANANDAMEDTNIVMEKDVSMCMIQSIMSNLLANILMKDKSLLERTMNAATHTTVGGIKSAAAFSSSASPTAASNSSTAPAAANANANADVDMEEGAEKSKSRDAKTLLFKSFLTTMVSAIDAFKTLSRISSITMDATEEEEGGAKKEPAGSTARESRSTRSSTNRSTSTSHMLSSSSSSSSKNNDQEEKMRRIQYTVHRTLTTIEKLISVPKPNPNSLKRKIASAASYGSSSSSASASSNTGGSTSGSMPSVLMHVPVTSQHAHSVSCDVRGVNEWNYLMYKLDRGDMTMKDGHGHASGGNSSPVEKSRKGSKKKTASGVGGAGGTDTAIAGARGNPWWSLNDHLHDCQIVSDVLASELDCQWMHPFVMVTEDAECSASPPAKRKRKSKSSAVASSSVRQYKVDYEEKLKVLSQGYDGVQNLIEGRIAIRKLASSAFVHCCAGQYHLLDSLRYILKEYDGRKGNGGMMDVEDVSGHQKEKMEKELEGKDLEGQDEAANFRVNQEVVEGHQIKWSKVMDPGPNIELEISPSVSTASSTSTSASSKKPKKKRGGTTAVGYDSNASSPTLLAVGGHMALSILSTRIVGIIQESNKVCGIYNSRNGMEEYVRTVYDPMHGVKVLSGQDAKDTDPKTTHRRPSIYNLVICVSRLILLNHGRCLKNIARNALKEDSPFNVIASGHVWKENHGDDENQVSDSKGDAQVGRVMLNEEEFVMDGIVKQYAHYHPKIHKTIEALIKCVSYTSNSASRNDSKILLSIAAAVALKSSVALYECDLPTIETNRKADIGGSTTAGQIEKTVVVDAKLCSFAVFHLTDVMEHVTSMTKNSFRGDEDDLGSKDLSSAIIQHFMLDQPVAPGLSCNQACVFTDSDGSDYVRVETVNDEGWRHGYFLSLFLRVMLPEKAKKTIASNTTLKLIETLLEAVKTCYAVKEKDRELNGGGTKRRTRFTRCTLAADCFDAIRKCISQIPYSGMENLSNGKNALMTVRLRAMLRKWVPSGVVRCFVGLSHSLDAILIKPRMDLRSAGDVTAATTGSSHGESLAMKLEYEQWERRLWTAHIKCCLSFVRGSAVYLSRITNSSLSTKKSCVGSWNDRLLLFKALTRATSKSETAWPLYLSCSLHALVTGNITCDPLPRTVKEASPERFICEGFIQSIDTALNDPDSILNSNADGMEQHPNIQISDEEFPLSIRDAQLFVVALTRIPRKEQLVLTSKLVNALHESIQNIRNEEKFRSLLVSERALSGFVARVITVCSVIIDMVSSGKLLMESMCDNIGPLHYHLPSFIAIAPEDGFEFSRQECMSEWYKRESCFKSLWPDWELPSLPGVEVHTKIDPLSNDDIAKYKMLLETALELGFQSAPIDMCHLIFASWNASAKLCGIDNAVWTGPSKASALSGQSNASKLTSIRDDLCKIHYELMGDESSAPDSYLTNQLKRKRMRLPGLGRQGRGIEFLKIAVCENVKMLNEMSSTLDSVIDYTNPSPGETVVAEAALSYMSFLTAMFTTSGTDLLTALVQRDKNHRKRKSSSFSGDSMGDAEMDDDCSEDSGDSGGYHDFDDDEDEEEAQSAGMSRLHEVCDLLGSAPFHPDWLDANCRLRPGLSETTSVELAESILGALTGFGKAAFSRYGKVLKELLEACTVLGEDDESTVRNGFSALLVIRGLCNDEKESGVIPPESSWQDDVADTFSLDDSIVRAIMKDFPCRNTDSVKESFGLNSAHRVKGKLQDFLASGSGWRPSASEYRATGEWELLLSDALIGPCSMLDISRSTEAKSGTGAKELKDLASEERDIKSDPKLLFLSSEVLRWKRVLHSLANAMIPVSALLRFGLNGAKGRQQHRARTHFENADFNTSTHLLCQTSPIRQHIRDRNSSSANMSSYQLKKTINKALCFLAEVQSCGFSPKATKRSARSATCHLAIFDNDIINLEGVFVIRNALVAMREYSRTSGNRPQTGFHVVFKKLVESMTPEADAGGDPEKRLLFCLGSPLGLNLNTIAESSVDVRTMLRKFGSAQLFTGENNWDWSTNPHNEIKFLTEIVQGLHTDIASSDVRLAILSKLNGALDAEDSHLTRLSTITKTTIRASILEHWSSLGFDQLQALVKDDICCCQEIGGAALSETDKPIEFRISRQLCELIMRLLGAASNGDSGVEKMFVSMLASLKHSMQYWVNEKELSHVLCVTCVLAMRAGSLNDIGKALFHIIVEKDSDKADKDLFILELFYRFLQDTRKALSGESEGNQKPEQPVPTATSTECKVTGNAQIETNNKLDCCTFVSTHGEFTEQHWYNCYTCGLTWDKGCCSLCARVCHKGHDVGYSRKSSFFCDCGAEVRTNAGRISCKCLDTLPTAVLSTVHDNDTKIIPAIDVENSSGQNVLATVESKDEFWKEAIALTVLKFSSTAMKTIDDFVQSIDATLIGELFDTLNAQFDVWANKESLHAYFRSPEHSGNENSREPMKDFEFFSRDGTNLDLKKVTSTSCFAPIRMSRTNTVSAKISSDLTLDKSKKILLQKNTVERKIIAADSRGRLVIGEPKCLVFCGALPLVNTRHVLYPLEVGLQRSQLCVLGTHKVDFGIVGLSLCSGRDRHLVAWGFSSARFFVLNESCNKVDLSIDLTVDFSDSDCDTDYIIKIEWVTQTIVAVFCATSVKLYDIEVNCVDNAGRYSCSPSVNYILAYEDALIRSGVIVSAVFDNDPIDDEDDEEEDSLECEDTSKRIFVLFDTGRLFIIDFTIYDNGGGLDCEGDVSIDYDEGQTIPIGGVRRFNGTSPEPAESTTKSLGEGSCLVYMRQSGVLLYKCLSSAMVALRLNKNGQIAGSFEFLPHIIKSEILDLDGDSMSGPYTNWVELGRTGAETGPRFYRAAFVARSTRTNQPHLIYIEYNSTCSKVKRMKMPGNVNLTLSMTTSYEGLAAFSGPTVTGNPTDNGMVGPRGSFFERAYLVSLTSNGILSFHGEEEQGRKESIRPISTKTSTVSILANRQRAQSDSGLQTSMERVKFKDSPKPLPSFPLTIFETLQNITSANELVFGGDGVGDNSAVTKRKLSTGSNEYIVSPSKEGCTFIVRLEKQGEKSKEDKTSAKLKIEDPAKLVIVAVRILLGTNNTNFMPREISVMGRSIKPTRDKKRWYDVPLTDEEIMIGARAGFVSICINGTLEGDRNQALVDSIEVYAEERSKLPHLFPISTIQPASTISRARNVSNSIQGNFGGSRKSLDTSIVVISHIFQLLGGTSGLSSKISEESLRRLIQVTALDCDEEGSVRNYVIGLLRELEPDPHVMQMLLDQGTLQGIYNVMKDLESVIANKPETASNDGVRTERTMPALIPNHISARILGKVIECLSAATAIVKDRPTNYKSALEKLISNGDAASSIALYSKKFVDRCQGCQTVVETSSKLMELAIHEVMSNSGEQSKPIQSFADLTTLSSLLNYPNNEIVTACCATIAKVLKDLPAQVLLHQCDCCGVLPITGMRYTMDEEGYDIDLCQECYRQGIAYAASQEYDQSSPVLVRKNPIHISRHNKDLSCAEICQMSSKAVSEDTSIEQLPHFNTQDCNKADVTEPDKMSIDEEDAQLQIALKMSLESQIEPNFEVPTSASLRALIFKNLLDGVVRSLTASDPLPRNNCLPIMNLLLKLVLQSNKPEERIDLGQTMCEALCKELSILTAHCVDGDMKATKAVTKRRRYSILLYLRTLISLLTKQDQVSTTKVNRSSEITASKSLAQRTRAMNPASKSKTDPRFVCETHRVPAVRRRCSHGEHKDRRFYVCGMDRKNRCKYFKWADEIDATPAGEKASAQSRPAVQKLESSDTREEIETDRELQAIMWKQLNGGNPPLHKKLCSVLRSYIITSKAESAVMDENSADSNNAEKSSIVHEYLSSSLESIKNGRNDGTFISVEKLGILDTVETGNRPEASSLNSKSNDYLGVEASLDFLSLVTGNSADIKEKAYASWEVWYSPLCHVINKESPAGLKALAKRMLRCITGGRRATYHQVRDRFVFASEFMDLLSHCEAPLQAALFVRQKAQQCGPQWRQSSATWETLSSGGLLGVQALVSEDSYAVSEIEKISKVLDHLVTITKARSGNWRHFCALEKLPLKDSDLEGIKNSDAEPNAFLEGSVGLSSRSPICLLFWMVCSLPERCQCKLLQLMDVALKGSEECPTDQTGASTRESSHFEDSHGILTTDVGTDAEAGSSSPHTNRSNDDDTPEKVLLGGASGLSMNDIHAFTKTFVLFGSTAKLRSYARNIVLSLTAQSSVEALNGFFSRMVALCVTELGHLGIKSIEFLQFLTTIVSDDDVMKGVDISFLNKAVIACFTKQTSTNCNVINSPSNKNIYELKSRRDKTTIRRYDLTKCNLCHFSEDAVVGNHAASGNNPFNSSPASTKKSRIQSADTSKKMAKIGKREESWAHGQLYDFRRIRLDNHPDVSTEFSSFVMLQTRMAISEIFLTVSDQRGRFVKTIVVYFTPRPVNNLNELKEKSYEPLWQRCGTLSLSRGANKVSCKMPRDVVAANLKFEYVDFYEKITGPRTASGAMVLHCPRCTRIVNNAHGGVCGHCGEVAFQCRKCRHINYDRLDAFLCVECGYCSSGSFSFEAQAGEATSAVAIQDETDLERAVTTLHAQNKKSGEVRNLLKKQVLQSKTLAAGSKRKRESDSMSEKLENLSGPLKRALLGELPKITISKTSGDKKRDSKRKEMPPSRSSASNRARSLLSLARQLRGESDGDVRSSLGDILVQQARLNSASRGSFPFDDAEDDMLIQRSGDGNLMAFDLQDPLSRLVANIQARARGDLESSRGDGETKRPETADERRSKKIPNSKASEETDKYFTQLRGIELDCFEISKRIVAWKRLNQDTLADHGAIINTFNYSPVLCSESAPAVTHCLLELAHSLLKCNKECSETALCGDFIRCLFDNQPSNRPELMKLKRAVLVTLAKKSPSASKMVLDELALRIAGGRDPISAAILGELLKNSVRNKDNFIELAVKTLGGCS